MTDENTKTGRSVADCLPSDFAARAYEHYAKALRKHPRFADTLFETNVANEAESALKSRRYLIDYLIEHNLLDGVTLTRCEIEEAQLAHAQGDKAATIDELYDAVAVLMRMIATVEGKQRLGGEA